MEGHGRRSAAAIIAADADVPRALPAVPARPGPGGAPVPGAGPRRGRDPRHLPGRGDLTVTPSAARLLGVHAAGRRRAAVVERLDGAAGRTPIGRGSGRLL
ncbi:MAG: hypothetical protein MZV63_65690 [Marinilabiliales bacterium]|nr:hypothetical protein [Marinilabiliales bacterium]